MFDAKPQIALELGSSPTFVARLMKELSDEATSNVTTAEVNALLVNHFGYVL